jgi:3-oxoacyl-(acyl-carrier-protein) synthase
VWVAGGGGVEHAKARGAKIYAELTGYHLAMMARLKGI